MKTLDAASVTCYNTTERKRQIGSSKNQGGIYNMPIPENKIRTSLQANRPTVATRLFNINPTSVEAAACTGNFDYVEFLAEYAPHSLIELENFVRAAELHHIGTLIKIDFQNRHYVAQKAAAAGFQGVLFSDHKTADEVAESIYCLSPDCPDGGRFGFPNARWIAYTDHLPQQEQIRMERNIVKAFMIEKAAAVDNIREICSVSGVDMIQFGPSDYSMSRGWNASEHKEELREIEEYVIRIALECGVAPRCECDTVEMMEYYRNLGVRHFCIGDELRVLKTYWNDTCGQVRKLADQL